MHNANIEVISLMKVMTFQWLFFNILHPSELNFVCLSGYGTSISGNHCQTTCSYFVEISPPFVVGHVAYVAT